MNAPLDVVCLCAEWCGACREYRSIFDRLAAGFGARCCFVWLDIEDESDRVDGIDVDNFPTLLLARAGEPLFYGTLLPHAQTLRRLVDSALAGDLTPAAVDPAVAALAGTLG